MRAFYHSHTNTFYHRFVCVVEMGTCHEDSSLDQKRATGLSVMGWLTSLIILFMNESNYGQIPGRLCPHTALHVVLKTLVVFCFENMKHAPSCCVLRIMSESYVLHFSLGMMISIAIMCCKNKNCTYLRKVYVNKPDHFGNTKAPHAGILRTPFDITGREVWITQCH